MHAQDSELRDNPDPNRIRTFDHSLSEMKAIKGKDNISTQK